MVSKMTALYPVNNTYNSMTWKNDASCNKIGIKMWFSRRTSEDGQLAVSICNTCPVKKECLEYIMKEEKTDGLRIGIWAGLGPYERIEYNNEL